VLGGLGGRSIVGLASGDHQTADEVNRLEEDGGGQQDERRAPVPSVSLVLDIRVVDVSEASSRECNHGDHSGENSQQRSDGTDKFVGGGVS